MSILTPRQREVDPFFNAKRRTGIDYGILDNFLAREDLRGLNGMQICKALYEVVYMAGVSRYWEERNLRERYEKNIVNKVGEIDRLEKTISALEAENKRLRHEQTRMELPEEVRNEAEKIIPRDSNL